MDDQERRHGGARSRCEGRSLRPGAVVDDPEFAEFLVECGIDSMSVSPDSFVAVKHRVAQKERMMQGEPATLSDKV